MFSKNPLMMSILNVTPDSFSGDGVLVGGDYGATALASATRMMADGADIIDIGGESSRPGAEPVSAAEEMRRTVPVIAAIRKAFSDIHISIDTVKSSVAAAAIQAGATIVNDISALQADPEMTAVVAETLSYIVLMDNRADGVTHDKKIGGEYGATNSTDIVEDVKNRLAERAAFAESVGIARDKIILDPGIGFGKTVEQNLALIRELPRLKSLGYPVLLGTSRKSFIGRVLDLGVDERLEGTAATVAIGAFLGADILRVHDVQCMARVVRMATVLR
jgi:dihydropteroate synthase